MKITLLAVLTALCLTASGTQAQVHARTHEIDNTIWAQLLNAHVQKGRVDYEGFKADEPRLDQYLDILSNTEASNLPRNHRLAFFINAYNAFTVKLILSRYPEMNSIKELGGFFSGPWDKKFIRLGRWTVSLDHIEHEVLRHEFKDPRIHFAINCAAKSCPPLLNMPFEAKTIEQQLDTQTRAFINSGRAVFVKGHTIFASKIFDWFYEDFNGNPLLFIRQYANASLLKDLDRAGPEPDVTFLFYDWSLNRR